MIRATRILAKGQWPKAADDSVVLDYDQRHRRRMAMEGAGGLAFLLDLADAVPLQEGDGLQLEDGRIVAVSAAPEPLAEITAASAAELMRIAWHLGNRHLPADLRADRIRIRRDHVIEEMVQGLGAEVAHIEAPFDPESGAYRSAGGHHHHNPALDHDDRIEDEEPERG
jgi:urease accessory protein